jgi:putative GTP pyrophosphokinase
LHFDARWRDVHVGPRNDDIRAIGFEIQVRTIVMDAWANISHYLAYKGESSIPEELRRDFFALSGLFYVADTHFEMLSGRSRDIEERAESELAGGSEDLEVTLESLSAFLASRFPDRKRAGRDAISELADELRQFGVDRIAQLDPLIASASERFSDEESRRGTPFADVGVIRGSLATVNPAYDAFLLEKGQRAIVAARSEV